jgi:hypothetical protein
MSPNFRLFLASIITADGWKAPLQIPELRLLFSLLLCKPALPENNLHTFADNLQTPEDNLQTTEEDLQTTEDNLRTTEDNLQTTEDLHIPDDDNLQTLRDSQHAHTKREIKDEDGFALDEMEEKCEKNIAFTSQGDQNDAEKTVNDVTGSKILSKKRQRTSSVRAPRRRIAEKKRRKTKAVDLDRTCCSVCGKQFVGAERLAQHKANHVVDRVVLSTGGAVVIRCMFERCGFEAAEDEGSSSNSSSSSSSSSSSISSSNSSRLRAAIRVHELKHSCPICRSVYPTADQIR